MTVRCLMCSIFTGKDRTDKQKELGLYRCRLEPVHVIHVNPFIERTCDKFKEVPEGQKQARIDWEKKR